MEDNENKVPENQETSDLREEVQGNPESKKDELTKETEVSSSSEPVEEGSPQEEPSAQTEDSAQHEGEETHEDESDDGHESEEENKLLELLDFHDPLKSDLLSVLKKFSGVEKMRLLDKALKEVHPAYMKIYEQERANALTAFVNDGNDEEGFDYKGDETDASFFVLYESLRHKKQKYFSELERNKDANLIRKNEILEQLRELVDGEESTTSINALKQLQEEWKRVGQVPGAHVKSLWANYNALIDRFYDNRSIYFELKELDRRKNLESKIDLCERAEALDGLENLKDAIFQLNELHEEFKHIGPIPKEDQEPVWQRFKAASDKVYAKRKDYFEQLKKDLGDNADKKQELGDRAEEFAKFDSDRITEWNKKTKELLELQKGWDAIGGLPRDRAKHINKHFWGNFKQFFSNKSAFFKTLEGQREENMKKKQELLEKAEALKDSADWDKAANELKQLQNRWREIGPVPERHRNEVYPKFKAACDYFFERKRSQNSEKNKEFDDNLRKKEEICNMLDAYINSDTIELDQVYDLLDRYAEIGFVPRNAIKKIHNRYDEVTDRLINLEELTEDQRAEIKIQVQLSKLKNSPHSGQKIHRKEGAIRRKISSLENDIATWKTNMGFFAASKNADHFIDEFNEKIEKASQELDELRKQLEVLNQM